MTGLLAAWGQGRPGAVDAVLPAVYEQLHRIAGRQFGRERQNHTLQPTALVHEAYLKLLDQRHAAWQNREQFFAIAAQVMRRVLVDHARARHAAKRGAGAERVSLDTVAELVAAPAADVLELDDALSRLASFDPRQARVVELRCFGGLSIEETAEAMNLSPTTVKQEWRLARAWLHRALGGASRRPESGES